MRNKFGLVILAVTLLGASGCSSVPDAVNPISWYRDATGISKNDDLGKGENEQNLAEGSNEPYPNLGNVPSAPDNQLSGVDRDKLEKSLVADRNNAQYSADNLRAGDVASTVPPPAPPAPKSSSTSSTATIASAPEPPPAPPAPPVTTNAPTSPPQAASPPPPTPSPAATATPVPPPANKTTANNTQQRKPVRGSEAPPAESSLQSPSIPNLPQGETPTAAPPAPRNAQVANAAPPSSTRAPVLRPPGSAPTQQASAPGNAPATAAPHRPGISYRVADVSFAPGSAYLSGSLRGTIAEIVKIHSSEGGTIRIVGFGESTGKDAAVAGLTLALDRAQAVAVALTDSGVAAKDIAVEAAPVPAKGGADAPRAEVYLEH
ncbi:MAG TPA: OmpA family protein [Stellaceae bacterium]|nr:OmpA family protein [Stellaceae bacterium]